MLNRLQGGSGHYWPALPYHCPLGWHQRIAYRSSLDHGAATSAAICLGQRVQGSGCKYNGHAREAGSVAGLELIWVLSLDKLSSHMVTSTLGNNKISKMSFRDISVFYGAPETLNSLKLVFSCEVVWAQ